MKQNTKTITKHAKKDKINKIVHNPDKQQKNHIHIIYPCIQHTQLQKKQKKQPDCNIWLQCIVVIAVIFVAAQ